MRRSAYESHGMSRSKTYSIWSNMLARCTNPKATYYDRYGGRGIKVCDEWLMFKQFLIDMGEKPIGKTLERIDNEKGYFPSNCRWATPKEQAENRSSSQLITYNGITQCLSDWAKQLGVQRLSLRWRIKNGWSIEEALTVPFRKFKGN